MEVTDMQTPSNNETKSSDLEASCMILFLHELQKN